MRTLRAVLVGMVIIALLGGLSGAVLAQDEEQTATHVTGRVISGEWGGATSETAEGSIQHMLDMQAVRQVEWSVPRLPPTMTGRMNLDAHWRETDAILPWASTHRLDGPDGAWTVTERGFMEADGAFALLVLTGEGAYEGLSAMLVEVVSEEITGDSPTIWEGYIFEGGLPPLPDPVEPPAE
jgi:hypothetical protein